MSNKKTAAFRITADLCFYFAVLHVFTVYREQALPLALFVVAAYFATLVASFLESWPLRFFISLLPGLCFLMIPIHLVMVFPLLAWLYLIIVLTGGFFFMWLDDYRRVFLVLLAICLLFVVANILQPIVSRKSILEPFVVTSNVISMPSLIYMMLFLFFGVITMRLMQMNAPMRLPWHLGNLGVVIGLPAVAAGLAGLFYLLLRGIEALLWKLADPLDRFFTWLFWLFYHPDNTPSATPPPSPSPTPQIVLTVPNPQHGIAAVEEPDRAEMWWGNFHTRAMTQAAMAVVLLVLLALILFLLLRYIRRSKRQSLLDDLYYEDTEAITPDRRRRSTRGDDLEGGSHARQLRRIYRQYLELMRKNGVIIHKDDTSLDVIDAAETIALSEEAKRLRELYLKARYADGATVTAEDVQEAKACLKAIQNEPAWKR